MLAKEKREKQKTNFTDLCTVGERNKNSNEEKGSKMLSGRMTKVSNIHNSKGRKQNNIPTYYSITDGWWKKLKPSYLNYKLDETT